MNKLKELAEINGEIEKLELEKKEWEDKGLYIKADAYEALGKAFQMQSIAYTELAQAYMNFVKFAILNFSKLVFACKNK